MGTQADVEFAYNDIDKLWRLSLGEYADITAGFYNGNYTKSLEQAQRDKHNWVLEGISFQPGQRILDIGSGWGPMLRAIKERKGDEVGLTLSRAQLNSCRVHDLDARLQDWKYVNPDELGRFDGIVSIGAFEHFCSVEEYFNGKRDEIYNSFFKFCNNLLPKNGRLYLQTMTFGKNVPWGADNEPTMEDIRKCSLNAPIKSDERVLAGMRAFFPGSWVPKNAEHLVKIAHPYFELIRNNDGRIDYVQTITEWEKAWHSSQKGKTFLRLKTLPRYIFGGSEYRAKMQAIKRNDIREVFIRDLFGHQRMFFEKK